MASRDDCFSLAVGTSKASVTPGDCLTDVNSEQKQISPGNSPGYFTL
jgi:hypothetical protein